MADTLLAFRALDPRDAGRPIGDRITTASDLPAALDSRVPTNDFATADLVMIHTSHARPDGADVVVPAGTSLVVRGRRGFTHHLASAVDIEVDVLFVADAEIDEATCDAEFTRAMLMLSKAMASGDSGRGSQAPHFSGPLA